jgi:signal transduction histidine kinase
VRRVPNLPDESRTGLQEAISALDAAIRDIRGYVMDLRPADFSGDLGESLEGLLRLFETTSGLRVTFERTSGLPIVDEAVAVELFLLVREALSNVRRHARAASVRVTLSADAEALHLLIEDDGAGFDPTSQRREEQFGLRNMETRARLIGGDLTLDSHPGDGTRIDVRVPMGRLASVSRRVPGQSPD